MPDGKRLARIKQLTDQLNQIENLRIPVSKGLLRGLQYAVQNVGEGGEITVWMPSSLAFGERGNRLVHGNDAVVMNIHLKSVSYGPAEEELATIETETEVEGTKLPKFENGILTPKHKPGIGTNNETKSGSDSRVVVRPVEKK